ncbi:MAG: sugar ABC transporter ATP-binding protein [Alphaproteobacteria bacterium]|nr:sugar ABC transporter ATP-binding protein [Alphaproteobacteria bacterium]
MTELIRASAITKRYGGTLALDAVDFAVEAGEVHVLIGENGAGKSTLMRILAGIEAPSSGTLILDDEVVTLTSVRDAAAKGIGMVHQELNLCPNLTVSENIFLSHGGALPDLVSERKRAAALMARLGRTISADVRVEALSVGDQQIVEIAKALAEECRVLIFDEPTSALSAAEVETLFDVIADLKHAGVGIIYISHKLEELMRIGDRISILRNGRMIETRAVVAASLDWIVTTMIGEERRIARTESHTGGTEILSIAGAFNVRFNAGEVTAIYGLLGSGRTTLLETLFGARAGGTIWLDGADLTGRPIAERVKHGLLFVPEDRKRNGLFANFTVAANLSLSDLSHLARWSVIDRAQETGQIAAMIERLGIKTASPDTPITALSGGNQQKVLIGRALMPGPKALLLDEPGRGVDVGARAELFETIRDLAAQGLAVAFTSSDLIEVMNVADRIIVLARGQISLDMRSQETDEKAVVAAANRASAPLEIA